MGKFIVGVICLIVGVVIGAVGGAAIGGGFFAGAGLGTGLSSGVCMTVEAAGDLGLLSAEQIDQVLTRAVENLSKVTETAQPSEIVWSSEWCDKTLQKLRAQE